MTVPAPFSHPFLAVLVATASATLFIGCDHDKTTSAPAEARSSVRVTPSPSTAKANPEAITNALPPEAPQPPAPPEPLVETNSIPTPVLGVNPPAPTLASALAAPNAQSTTSIVDAWDEIKDYTYAQKTELVARVELMIAELDRNLDAIRGSSSKPELADTRSARLAALDNSRAILVQKRDALQYASAETWQSSKTEFRSAWRAVASDLAKLKAASN